MRADFGDELLAEPPQHPRRRGGQVAVHEVPIVRAIREWPRTHRIVAGGKQPPPIRAPVQRFDLVEALAQAGVVADAQIPGVHRLLLGGGRHIPPVTAPTELEMRAAMEQAVLSARPVQLPNGNAVVVRDRQPPTGVVEGQSRDRAGVRPEDAARLALAVQQPDNRSIGDHPHAARMRHQLIRPCARQHGQLPRPVFGMDLEDGTVVGPAQKRSFLAIGDQRQHRTLSESPDREAGRRGAQGDDAHGPIATGKCRVAPATVDSGTCQRRVDRPSVERVSRHRLIGGATAAGSTPLGNRESPRPARSRPGCGR